MGFNIQNQYAGYTVAKDGLNLELTDKTDGKNYCRTAPDSFFARVKKAGKMYNPSSVSFSNGKATVDFGPAKVRAVIRATAKEHYFIFEVLSVSGEGVEELHFAEMNTNLRGEWNEPFACCTMALNLKTNNYSIPGLNSSLQAICYRKFGFVGAKAAVVACPQKEMRRVMQEVVSSAPDLPHSNIGGPWALDADINHGSYLFNFDGITLKNIDDWIRLAKSFGIDQIDFHGGNSFRFGDCRPNPKTYPNGRADLKAVIDKLHEAGIKAGLHTYAFFIDKSCPWVTPVPDPRLGTDAVFMLSDSISADAKTVPVVQSTEKVTTTTGFFVRNSVILRIDDELITFNGASKTYPYTFTECKRGALGTKSAPHNRGAKAYHLKEMFGLLTPDGDSLLSEVAAATAETFNECGFDMIYLDALDGEGILDGNENGWHYGSKFVFEICKRLDKPALMEMSTFHHHLWYARSRMGALDTASRSEKRFIDNHCAMNNGGRKTFLPQQFGWWSVRTGGNQQMEPTFPDTIEYLMCKCLATDTGFALMGVDPKTISVPAFQRLSPIFQQYEKLRRSDYFSDSVKAKLAEPGAEFHLEQASNGKWQFRPMQYSKHKVEGMNSRWTCVNKFGRQKLQLRIEGLMSAEPYDSANGITIADFSNPADLPVRETAPGVTTELTASTEKAPDGAISGLYSAERTISGGPWAKVSKAYSPYLNISKNQALGVWVYGDGQGELLSFRPDNPSHVIHGMGDRFVVVDFTGWRYFELIEPEGERIQNYSWPYGADIYREGVEFSCVDSLSVWYNNLPAGKKAACYLSPIRALPLVKSKLLNPRIKVGDKTITFPVEIEGGHYLEFRSMTDCKLYGPDGALIADVKPQGEIPTLASSENQVEFNYETLPGISGRAYITIITEGDAPLR